jgi:phospholipid/cholesterol/gamma-HCH transport system ATP-binding protein
MTKENSAASSPPVSDPLYTRDAHVVLEEVEMAYGSRPVFSGLSCTFPRGKISVILGGSGSGKSTMLRLIGGLVRPQRGRVLVEGENVARLGERGLYAVRNKLGMMFQHGALLDSMSVFDNVAFPLREHSDLTEAEITDRVHRRLEAVGLLDVDRLRPTELSGGMTKRVALARALMHNPVIVLADEAFSGLDPVSIKLIEALLVRINREFDMTMILVSHHIPSTLRMAHKVVLVLPAEVIQGSPTELVASDDPRVVRFLNENVDDSSAVLENVRDFEAEVAPRTSS